MSIAKNEIFLRFKANRYSFGTLSIDHELVNFIYDYLNYSESAKLAQVYSSINIDDLYIVKYYLDSKRDSDISNEYDYPLKELLNRVEHANKLIIDFRPYDKVLFGYVTLNEDNAKYKNRQKLLLESILSLSVLNYNNWRICIYLNKPNDELLTKLSELRFAHNIYTITSEKNMGLAYGRNRILDYAKNNYFDYVMFLDDDTYMIDKYLIEKLLYCENLRSTFAFIGPEIVYKKSKVRKHGNHFFIEPVLNKFDHESFEEVDFIEGSCHMIDVNKIGANTLIGEYPEDFNCYWEESLLAFRAWHCAKLQNIVVKGARIVHIVDGGGFLNQSSLYFFVRNFIFFIKDVGIFMPLSFYKKIFYTAKLLTNIIIKIPIYDIKYYAIIVKALFDGIFDKRQPYSR